MVKQKFWYIANVSLGIISFLLLLTLFGVSLPTIGKAQYWLNSDTPFCAVQWKGDTTPWQDIDRCCLQAREQLFCQREQNNINGTRTHWSCQTGSGEVIRYLLNTKAFGYCHLQPYWR